MLGTYPLKGPGCTRVTSMRSLLFVCRLGSMKVSCGNTQSIHIPGVLTYTFHSGMVLALSPLCIILEVPERPGWPDKLTWGIELHHETSHVASS